jgi:hypothetical protein
LVACGPNDSFGLSAGNQCPGKCEIPAIGQHGFQGEHIDMFARRQRLARQHRFINLQTSHTDKA